MRLATISAAALAASLAACGGPLTKSGSVENAQAPSVCLASYAIDHTDIPDDSTIIFTMRDHSVWKNTLPWRCTGLHLDTRGFTYAPTDPGSDTICSNLVTIRTNTDGNVCELGTFARISQPSPKG